MANRETPASEQTCVGISSESEFRLTRLAVNFDLETGIHGTPEELPMSRGLEKKGFSRSGG
ncbi:hypothetical protein LBMAG56_14760 [Verrucomicrobiota bacterium]|nr:hypothetical protein LBMAG56_14760 [Verrucomicrobiota bacterium]